MVKIGFCIDSLEMGGAEKLLVDIINMLYKTKKYEIYLITKNESNSYFYNEIKYKVKYSYLISKKKEEEYKNKIISGKLLASLEKKRSFKSFESTLDVIIDFLDCDFYKFIKKVKNKKTIVWLHGNYKELQKNKKIDFKIKFYNKIIVTTEDMYNQLKRIKNLSMIYNLIDFKTI
ncbi:MAG: glycosyltransferase, partial [Cetobacterium sp.]